MNELGHNFGNRPSKRASMSSKNEHKQTKDTNETLAKYVDGLTCLVSDGVCRHRSAVEFVAWQRKSCWYDHHHTTRPSPRKVPECAKSATQGASGPARFFRRKNSPRPSVLGISLCYLVVVARQTFCVV